MRYAVDLRHPLQAPCGGDGSSCGDTRRHLSQSRPWECGNPEGISKECGKGGKPASWLSMLSILCHFHGLLWSLPTHLNASRPRAIQGACPRLWPYLTVSKIAWRFFTDSQIRIVVLLREPSRRVLRSEV